MNDDLKSKLNEYLSKTSDYLNDNLIPFWDIGL